MTVCTHERKHIFSQVVNDIGNEKPALVLTELGGIVNEVLREMKDYKGMRADAWIIMPDHIHIIIMKEATTDVALGEFVGAFKSVVTKRWRDRCNSCGVLMGKIWQRNYYDHILRNAGDYLEKVNYMANNPVRWCEENGW